MGRITRIDWHTGSGRSTSPLAGVWLDTYSYCTRRCFCFTLLLSTCDQGKRTCGTCASGRRALPWGPSLTSSYPARIRATGSVHGEGSLLRPRTPPRSSCVWLKMAQTASATRKRKCRCQNDWGRDRLVRPAGCSATVTVVVWT
jgi:hypothetical protein